MKRWLALIFLTLSLLPQLAFAYADPTLKVLLATVKTNITLESKAGLAVEGWELPGGTKKLKISYQGAGKVKFHGQSTKAALMVTSSRNLLLKTPEFRRPYAGSLEIRPFEGGFYVINHISTEEYLQGVLNAEISTQWDPQAVMAQAILARTYALRKLEQRAGQPWHLRADHLDQVYRGAALADDAGRYALAQTRGLVMKYQGQLAETFYHSNCGGVTENPGNLWAYDLPYYRVKAVPFGQEDPRFYWQTLVTDEELQKLAAKIGAAGLIKELSILLRNESRRAQELLLVGEEEDFILDAKRFRAMIGYEKVKSLLFEIERVEGGYQIKGQGNGHGVGLCQWAAKEMAESGYNFAEIIGYFYDGVEVEAYRSES